MFAFAFKNGKRAAELETGVGKLIDEEVCRVTGGEYSHVECWLSGPVSQAVCSASRPPDGIGFETIDLGDRSLWSIVEIPSSAFLDLSAYWFSKGSDGKRYDAEGIIGIGTGTGIHDRAQRFCSEYAAEIGDQIFGLKCLKDIQRWMVAPSGLNVSFGNGRRRVGLRDLLLAAGYRQI